MTRYSELMNLQGASFHWGLNEAPGATTATSSTGNLNLVYDGAYVLDQLGVVGRSVLFGDGALSRAYLTTPSVTFDSTNGFSASAMFMMNKALTTNRGIFGKRNASDSSPTFLLWINYTNGFFYVDLGATTSRWQTNFSPQVNTWYHVAFTYAPAGSVFSLYVNGVLQDSTTAFSPTSASYTTQLAIGQMSGNSSYYFAGYIDEVAIWTRKTLSASEISAQYNTAFPITRVFNGTNWTDADRRIL